MFFFFFLASAIVGFAIGIVVGIWIAESPSSRAPSLPVMPPKPNATPGPQGRRKQ
jgi:ABC-type proline/glycine betaine transport system permease subunit